MFIGTMSGNIPNNTGIGGSASVVTVIQTGLWSGIEFNFMEKLSARAYANIIATPLGGSAPPASSQSSVFMIFSGAVDLVYHPTQKLGIFMGLGLGDTLASMTNKDNGLAQTILTNAFTLLDNYGV